MHSNVWPPSHASIFYSQGSDIELLLLLILAEAMDFTIGLDYIAHASARSVESEEPFDAFAADSHVAPLRYGTGRGRIDWQRQHPKSLSFEDAQVPNRVRTVDPKRSLHRRYIHGVLPVPPEGRLDFSTMLQGAAAA